MLAIEESQKLTLSNLPNLSLLQGQTRTVRNHEESGIETDWL